MDSSWDQWYESPSGSGAQDTWPTESPFEDSFTTSADAQGESYAFLDEEEGDAFVSHAFGADLAPGQLMSPKIPPAFTGKTSWFAYEELVYDWCDITQLDAKQLGPALKARLIDDAAVYKPVLDRDKLKDPTNGVEYFLKEL